MATSTGINSVITSGFIDRFRGLAAKSAGSGSKLSGASSVSISDGLRYGARNFSAVIKNLNSGIAFLNLAEDKLLKLQKLTKSMIEIADRASKPSTGDATRSDLDSELRGLGTQFKKIVEDASINSHDYLTVDGLTEILKLVGLDKESSSTIANIFKEFVVPEKDGTLASEYEKGSRPVIVPGGSLTGQTSDSTYTIQKVTTGGGAGSGSAISSVGSVVAQVDTVLNQNGTYQSAVIYNNNGTATTFKSGLLTADVTVVAVNQTNGYSAITSTQDFLGSNPSGIRQAFLVNTNGAVVSQLTSEADATAILSDFQLSSDNSVLGYIRQSYNSGTDTTTYDVMKNNTVMDTVSWQTVDDGSAITNMKMSADGDGFIYHFVDGGTLSGLPTDTTRVHRNGSGSDDIADLVTDGQWGWLSSTRLAIVGAPIRSVFQYDFGDGALGALLALRSGTHQELVTLEDASGNGFFAVKSSVTGTTRLRLFQVGSTTAINTYDVASGDSVGDISIAYDATQTSKINLGFTAELSQVNGDTATELYRLNVNTRATTGQKYARLSEEFDTIFDEENHIRSRGNAFRTLGDLKALDDQITKNIKALEDARETVGQNIELSRAAGLAFLDVSSKITTATKAEQVAIMLRQQIRSNAKTALSQAENLEPMIVAALAYDSSLK